MSFLSQITGGSAGSSRPPSATGSASTNINVWAHLALLCAIVPLAIILLLLIVEESNAELLGRCRYVGHLLVSLVTLCGAVFGLLGARCFWQDTRRGGMGVIVAGLLGCGMWVLYFDSVLDWVMGLF